MQRQMGGIGTRRWCSRPPAHQIEGRVFVHILDCEVLSVFAWSTGGDLLTLLYSLFKPCGWQQNFAAGTTCDRAFECMLKSYLPPVLLAQQTTNDWTLLLPCGVSGDVVGDGEEDQRVKLDVEARVRRLLRD